MECGPQSCVGRRISKIDRHDLECGGSRRGVRLATPTLAQLTVRFRGVQSGSNSKNWRTRPSSATAKMVHSCGPPFGPVGRTMTFLAVSSSRSTQPQAFAQRVRCDHEIAECELLAKSKSEQDRHPCVDTFNPFGEGIGG